MDLTKMLLPSRSVEVSLLSKDRTEHSDRILLKTIIESGFDGHQFKIVAPIYHGNIYPIHHGDLLDIICSTNDADHTKGIYSLKCKVISRSITELFSVLSLEVIEEPKKIQRRQAFRVKVFNVYKFMYKQSEVEMVTKDISSTGMLSITTFQMKTDDLFSIDFDTNPLPKEYHSKEKVISVRCRVLDSLPEPEIRRFINRIVFEGLNASDSKLILQYLYHKQTEIIHLEPNHESYFQKNYTESQSDRRTIVDPLMFRVQIMGLINLILVFLSFIFMLLAQPEPIYGLDRFFRYYRPEIWNSNYTTAGIVASISSILIGLIGLMMNAQRMKRKGDAYNRAIIISLIASSLIFITLTYFIVTKEIYIF
jgi:c-di-GMP-binding flagellar brake protein YcgR